jgi:hypothetical protein
MLFAHDEIHDVMLDESEQSKQYAALLVRSSV